MSNNEIVVNYLMEEKVQIFKIVPLKIHRDWMNKTSRKYAYQCLPLNIANQYGWAVICPFDFKVSYYGGNSDVQVEVFDIPLEYSNMVSGHFGHGTLTINPDFLIRTPENYSLYIRGVPNQEYGILKPLDAIVETDWLPFTFTYNFKFIDYGVVEFKKGDLLFSFFPILRNTVENFDITLQNIEKDPELFQSFQEYAESRTIALNERMLKPYNFQRFYIDGKGPKRVYNITNHIKRLFFKDPKENS